MVTRTKLHRRAGLLVMNLFLLVASHANKYFRTFVPGSPASPGHFRYMLYPLPEQYLHQLMNTSMTLNLY